MYIWRPQNFRVFGPPPCLHFALTYSIDYYRIHATSLTKSSFGSTPPPPQCGRHMYIALKRLFPQHLLLSFWGKRRNLLLLASRNQGTNLACLPSSRSSVPVLLNGREKRRQRLKWNCEERGGQGGMHNRLQALFLASNREWTIPESWLLTRLLTG